MSTFIELAKVQEALAVLGIYSPETVRSVTIRPQKITVIRSLGKVAPDGGLLASEQTIHIGKAPKPVDWSKVELDAVKTGSDA